MKVVRTNSASFTPKGLQQEKDCAISIGTMKKRRVAIHKNPFFPNNNGTSFPLLGYRNLGEQVHD
jgi:hypothetical protein